MSFRGGKARAYTPAKTAHAEAAIRYLLAANGAQMYPRDIPLSVRMTFWLVRPQSAPRRRIWPVTKPDNDNLQKLVSDAAESYLWEADQQIVRIFAEKRYCPDGVAPHILLEVEPL